MTTDTTKIAADPTTVGNVVAGNAVDEKLSAWLDGELPPGEMDQLAADAHVAQSRGSTLARYALIGETLRTGSPTALKGYRLAARVQEVLAAQPHQDDHPAVSIAPVTHLQRPRPGPRRWAVPLGLAASFFVVAALLLPGQEAPLVPPSAPLASSAATVAGEAPGMRQAPPLPPERLTNYLVYHGEYTGMLSTHVADSHVVAARPAVAGVSYTTLSGYDGREP